MFANAARHYNHAQVTPRRFPAQVIPLHPTVRQQVGKWARRTLTPEASAEAVLAVTTLVLSGVLLFAVYNGLQHYPVF